MMAVKILSHRGTDARAQEEERRGTNKGGGRQGPHQPLTSDSNVMISNQEIFDLSIRIQTLSFDFKITCAVF